VSVRVTSLTSGPVTPDLESLSGGYRWRKTPGWKPGDVRFQAPVKPGPGAETNALRKQARIARFEVILRELSGIPDGSLAGVKPEHVRRAGELAGAGVGPKTARAYWKALLRQEEARNG